MEFGRHALREDLAGNSLQRPGKHEQGIALVPLGNRDRCKPEYSTDYEERDSIDQYTKYLK